MRISVCIPQYNRIGHLLESLRAVACQTHPDVEICIADDASTDDTPEQILRFIATCPFPVRYERGPVNQGYDRALRRALDLATGDYCFLLGNDDAPADPGALARLAILLEAHQRPEVGFTNYRLDGAPAPVRRASDTALWPGGTATAWAHYASFAFVGGVFFRRDAFGRANADHADGSVFVQMYLAVRVLLVGGRLLTVDDPLVLKDLRWNGQRADSWQDAPRGGWRSFRPTDGGLPQATAAVGRAFADAGLATPAVVYRLWRKQYRQTYPYWLLEYRSHGGLVRALGLAAGLFPGSVLRPFSLNGFRRMGLFGWYAVATAVGLLAPTALFQRVKTPLYARLKRRKPVFT